MKRFKTKRKHIFLKYLFLLIIMLLSTYYTFSFLIDKYGSNIDKNKLIKYLIKEGFNGQLSIDLNNPLSISEPLKVSSNKEDMSVINNTKDPIVYIYNTHDEEKYNYIVNGAYNIVPNVRLASLILEEKLNDLGINTISEDTNIEYILNEHNWSYKDSYKASRLLLEKRMKEYKSLRYFIDIHRDSTNIDKVSLKYNSDTYAKILFVIGKENNNYQENLNMASKINDYINEIVPDISRGISLKEGPGVNGVYNQDISSNNILIEIGGDGNNIVDVSNSINILAEGLYKYIKGDDNAKEKI